MEPEVPVVPAMVRLPAVVACKPIVGVAVQLDAVVLDVFGIRPADAALVVLVPPLAIVTVGRSAAARAEKPPTPATAVAWSTSVVVVSEPAPTMYSLVLGKVNVTAPEDAG